MSVDLLLESVASLRERVDPLPEQVGSLKSRESSIREGEHLLG